MFVHLTIRATFAKPQGCVKTNRGNPITTGAHQEQAISTSVTRVSMLLLTKPCNLMMESQSQLREQRSNQDHVKPLLPAIHLNRIVKPMKRREEKERQRKGARVQRGQRGGKNRPEKTNITQWATMRISTRWATTRISTRWATMTIFTKWAMPRSHFGSSEL